METATFLLDTHTFLWAIAEPDKLSETVSGTMANVGNALLLSAASGWEAALLWKLGRISLPSEPQRFIPEALHRLSITPLPIGFDTSIAAATLPMIHRDPFDRLIVAEAGKLDIPVLSKDRVLKRYEIQVIW